MSDSARDAREALGRAISVQRTHLGLKRKDLAHASGLSYPYISELENGGKEPSAKALRQIADALGLGVSDLLTRAEGYEQAASDAPEPGASSTPAVAYNFLAALPPPPHGGPAWATSEQVAARTIEDLVQQRVEEQLRRELPRLVEREVQRVLAEIESGRTDRA